MRYLSFLFLMGFLAVSGAAEIIGTPDSDALEGTAAAEEIMGGDGDDVVDGGSGDDVVDGGQGDDELHGGSGNDELIGGSGNDELVGGDGVDVMIGGSGADRFVIDVPAGDMADWQPDQIFDFRPEEGDTVVLRYLNVSDRKLGAKNIYLNSRGELRMNIADATGGGLVNLYRSDLNFEYEADDREVTLKFKRNF